MSKQFEFVMEIAYNKRLCYNLQQISCLSGQGHIEFMKSSYEMSISCIQVIFISFQ